MLSDYVRPVKTVADISIEVWNEAGPVETINYRVRCEGYPDSSDITIYGVEARQCGPSAEDLHLPTALEAGCLVREFWLMWDNEGGYYDGERQQIRDQLREAIKSDTPEARREAAEHAAAESRYGGSL